tara:strand:+ start:50459 stop:51409 length:951 start_codon:yes stop_codon:yes gene_type:complete
MKIILNISIVLLLITGCSKEVEVDIPSHEEKLVVDGRIETNEFPIVLLSKSTDIYGETNSNQVLESFESGAVITVSDGTNEVILDEICSNNLPPSVAEAFAEFFGIEESELGNFDLCLYTTTDPVMLGEVGKTYSLNILYEGEEYNAQTTLLPPVPLDQIYWKEDPDNPDNGFCWATLSDPAGQEDAYFWEAKRIHVDSEGNPTDELFQNTFNPAFKDDFFDGLTFDYAYENPQGFTDSTLAQNERGYYQREDSVVVKFSKIDLGVYEFMEKKYIQLQTGGSPFATPLNLPSNISNGARGVWAGFSTTFDTLYCVE